MRYIGILDGSGRVWGVRIPDLPGCHGGGETAEAAIEDAVSAMREEATLVTDGGGTLAVPRTMKALRAANDVDFDPAVEAFVFLPLLLDKGRARRANVSFDAGLLEEIDAAARRRGLTRSSFLASAARDKILQEA